MAFTTESQLENLSKNYLQIAKKSNEKDAIVVLQEYVQYKERICTRLLEYIQNIKDKIREYSDDEWAIEVGGNLWIGDTSANIQRLLKAERYAETMLYPECGQIAADEGLVEISSHMWKLAAEAKKYVGKFQKLVS